MTDKIISRRADGVGHVVFNNPERRNAVSLEMWQAVEGALDAFADDDEVRVVVLSGAGDKAFVSGADISKFEDERSGAAAVARYNADHGADLRQARGVAEADHRPDHRQLRRRRRGARGVLRSARLRRGRAFRHPGGEARARLRLRRAEAPGRRDRPGVRQGDVLHRAPVLGGGGLRDGPGQPRGAGRPRSRPTSPTTRARSPPTRRSRSARSRRWSARC